MSKNTVVVGNIGNVLVNADHETAQQVFDDYVKLSVHELGKAAGESVTWFKDGEIHNEHIGLIDLRIPDWI